MVWKSREISSAAAAVVSIARLAVLPLHCDDRQAPHSAVAASSSSGSSARIRAVPWYRHRFSNRISPLVQDVYEPRSLKDFQHVDAQHAGIRVSSASETNVLDEHINEDRTVFLSRRDACYPFCILGVLDGHDGACAVDFVSRDVSGKVAQRLEAGSPVGAAFTNAFYELEEELRGMQVNMATCLSSGCCLLLIVICSRYAWCANLGDCRAFYLTMPGQFCGSYNWHDKIVLLSRDMKASELHEADRVRTAGGKIQAGRVLGLEPTRTIGDFPIKDKLPMGVISIVPEVRRLTLDEAPSTTLMIMATDGVWDVMSEIDVANIVAPHFQALHDLAARTPSNTIQEDRNGDLRRLCIDIIKASQDRGSTDDCTVQMALVSIKEASK